MSDWEDRMSQRAHAREVSWSKPRPEPYRGVSDDPRERWLHGWPMIGASVLMGTWSRCIGCGRDLGITTVAIDPDWSPPEQEPDWPFSEAHCPICWLSRP